MARLTAVASTQYFTFSGPPVIDVPLTISCWSYPSAASTSIRSLVSISDGTSNNLFVLRMSATEVLQASTIVGGAANSSASATMSMAVWSHCAGVFASTTSRTSFLNGLASTANTGSATVPTLNTMYFGANGAGSGTNDGALAEIGIWNAALTQAEITSLSKGFAPPLIRPDSLVGYWPLIGKASPEPDLIGGRDATLVAAPTAYPHPRIYYPGTAFTLQGGTSVTHYTITADAGSYALTGTAAGLRNDRKVSAAAGSYALTGTAATLKVGRKVAGAAGTYALTGATATLRRTYVPLAANAGAYALTGTAAGFKRGYAVAATSGAYTLTGVSAALGVGRKVAGATGSYALTGTPATLRRTYVPLDASAGAYALTGTTATLRRGYSLAATDGAYTLTGFTVIPQHAHKVGAAAGSYAITGAAATLRATIRLDAAAGAYSLTGQSASLRRGLKVPAAAGAYALTGAAATLAYSRKHVAAAGSYALTGTAAAFRLTHVQAAGAGAYTINGSVAALSYSGSEAILTAVPGAYSLTGTAATLRSHRALFPGVSAYALTGQDAQLTVGNRRLVAEAGSYSIDGQAVALTYAPAVAATAQGGGGGRKLRQKKRTMHVVRDKTGVLRLVPIAPPATARPSKLLLVPAKVRPVAIPPEPAIEEAFDAALVAAESLLAEASQQRQTIQSVLTSQRLAREEEEETLMVLLLAA